jgi:SAM-dependent methyltransferase
VGWVSSYTGDPIPPDEMRTWLRHGVARCAAHGARRVVDVGVGAGLFLRALAPGADSYLGLDVSEGALRRAEAALPAGVPPGRVRLERGDALALARLPEASADLVLLNSVVQYLPDPDHLRRVLREAVRVAGPRGAVFVGDVRDLALLDAFHAHVQTHRAPALTPAADVAAAAARALAEERELCLAAGFFAEATAGDRLVGAVRVELKRGSELNELTRFRYDVTLLGAGRADAQRGDGAAGAWRERWEDLAGLEDAASWLAAAPPGRAVTLTDVPNRRVVQPLAALRLLRGAHEPGRTAWDLQRLLWERDGAGAVDPERLARLGEEVCRPTLLLPSGRGDVERFDVLFGQVTR